MWPTVELFLTEKKGGLRTLKVCFWRIVKLLVCLEAFEGKGKITFTFNCSSL